MFKKIIEEITKALGLALLIVIAMLVIKAADLDLDSDTEDEVINIDGESTLGDVRERPRPDKEETYKDSEYAVGQVWQYKTRSGEEKSTIQIIGIDKYVGEEAIIHISIRGLIMANPMTESGISEEIGHMAFSRTSFSESVTTLLGTSEISADAKQSHTDWQVEYETKGGGMFTVGIAELVELTEQSMSSEQ